MESERENFRAYIEKSGLMSAMIDVLVSLYEEPNKPKDALNYVLESLSSQSLGLKQIDVLKSRCKDLETENQMLKEQLRKYEEEQHSTTKEESDTEPVTVDQEKEET